MQKPGRFVAALCMVAGVFAMPAAAQSVHKMATSSGLQAVGSTTEFEVLTQAAAGKADYFCAAGEFAKRWLDARNADRLVVTSVREPSQYRENRLAVAFALNAPPGQERDFLHVGGPRVGQSVSVGHSRALCERTRVKTVLGD